MSRALAIAFIAGLWFSAAEPPARYRRVKHHWLNDLAVTPGKIERDATLALICVPGYTSQPGVRHVTPATKRQVYDIYGATRVGNPPEPSSCCEVDHLISLELGGSNDLENLWPQPYPDAIEKDKVENALHWLVCHGRVGLRRAQRGIAQNWVELRDSLRAAGNWVDTNAENTR
ncbi:MAG: HNH endonuclease [Gemmatimonadetes bacterium]|nr:HNH endonuclease [Gemmatimonadota bacterium]